MVGVGKRESEKWYWHVRSMVRKCSEKPLESGISGSFEIVGLMT